jgi:hypothetical protein
MSRTATRPYLVPAGQAASAPAPSPPPVTVGPDGRIAGIDGMLAQIAGALVQQAAPVVLPALQNDKALQQTVGDAAGKAAARVLRPWAILGALSLATLAATGVYVATRPARRATRVSARSR